MAEKHTQGPWSAHKKNGEHANPYVCGPVVAMEHGNDAYVVAYLVGVNTAANARLIAQAPAMLAALRKARVMIDATAFNLHTSLSRNGKRNARPYFEVVAEIDALIAAATGEAP